MAKILVVDEKDQPIGAAEKAEVYARGVRHRIARGFVFDEQGRVLVHRRSVQLKDNSGKWDQSFGGHVDEGEDYEQAAAREAYEELGIELADLKEIGRFYIERPITGGVAKRFQRVYVAQYRGELRPNISEIAELRWLDLKEVTAWLRARPEEFTKNFGKAFAMVLESRSFE